MAEDAQGTSRLADPRGARRRAGSRLRDHRGAEARAAAARSTLPEGTVYPALHRLERAVCSRAAGRAPTGRRRRVYRLTRRGRDAARGEQERVARLRARRRRGARVSYVDDLSRELTRTGSAERARRRILAEVDDHLRSDAGRASSASARRATIANAFAAELGAQASRRAAVGAFAALGVAGAVYAAAFVSLRLREPAARRRSSRCSARSRSRRWSSRRRSRSSPARSRSSARSAAAASARCRRPS